MSRLRWEKRVPGGLLIRLLSRIITRGGLRGGAGVDVRGKEGGRCE